MTPDRSIRQTITGGGSLAGCRGGSRRLVASTARAAELGWRPVAGAGASTTHDRGGCGVTPGTGEHRRWDANAPAVTVEWLEGLLTAVGAVAVGRPGGRTWQCPAHDGNSPALRIRVGERGAIVYCWAGCSTDRVLARLRLRPSHLFRPPPGTPERYRAARLAALVLPPMDPSTGTHPAGRGMRLETVHEYGTPPSWWLLRWRHPDSGAKACEWESVNGRGERVPGLLGTPTHALPLYRDGDVMAGVALGEPVIVVESESSVDALNADGWHACTWAGGAATPNLDALRRVLGGGDNVVVIGDADGPGRMCASRISAALPLAALMFSDVDGEDARDIRDRVGAGVFRTLVLNALTERNSE